MADSNGYGWAITKALADAGATITIGTWPPVLKIFEKSLKNGKFDEDSILSDGSVMKIDKVRRCSWIEGFRCFLPIVAALGDAHFPAYFTRTPPLSERDAKRMLERSKPDPRLAPCSLSPACKCLNTGLDLTIACLAGLPSGCRL